MTTKCKWCGEAIYEGVPEGKKRIYAHEDTKSEQCEKGRHVASPAQLSDCHPYGDPEKKVFNVYRNTRFTKRNYECTNIAACMPVDEAATVPDGYEVAPAATISNMQPLWIEGGIQYWGWL